MPSLVSCSGVSIVIIFLSLCLCFNSAHADTWSNQVSNVQYGRLGSNMTLACGNSLNRTSVEWRLNKTLPLPWHQVTSEGSLVLLETDQSSEGNYSCHDDQGLLLQTIRLRLGQPPGQLAVSCRLPNHSIVLCSWEESVRTHLPGQFYASYRATISNQVQPCQVEPDQGGCVITEPTFWQKKHVLNVTQVNVLGTHISITALAFSSLLKPDPPEDVTVMQVEFFPRMLQVWWRPPSSWPQSIAFPLLLQLRYRPLGSSLWSSLDSKAPPPLVLTDILVNHTHQLQARVWDFMEHDSKWSDWSPLLLARPWTAPEPESHDDEEMVDFMDEDLSKEEGGVGLVILLSLFAAVILTTASSICILVWMRQRRRDHVTNHKLTSLVKLKSPSKNRRDPPSYRI